MRVIGAGELISSVIAVIIAAILALFYGDVAHVIKTVAAAKDRPLRTVCGDDGEPVIGVVAVAGGHAVGVADTLEARLLVGQVDGLAAEGERCRAAEIVVAVDVLDPLGAGVGRLVAMRVVSVGDSFAEPAGDGRR